MQHYGATSDFLDCTSDLDVALWFSHFEFQSKIVRSKSEDMRGDWQNLEHHFAWYELANAGTGFIYVFDVEDFQGELRDGVLIALDDLHLGTRPQIQHAALIYANPYGKLKGDLARFIKTAFEFPVPLPGLPRHVIDKRTSDLFPGPDNDTLYEHLLAAPFHAENPRNPSDLKRMIASPCYVNDKSELRNEQVLTTYIGRSRNIWPGWLFGHRECMARMLHESIGTHAHVARAEIQNAEVWILSAPAICFPVGDVSLFKDLGQPGEVNVCLEFSQYEVLGIPPNADVREFTVVFGGEGGNHVTVHRLPGCGTLRGLWVMSGYISGKFGYWYHAFFGWTGETHHASARLFFAWDSDAYAPILLLAPKLSARAVDIHTFLFRYVISMICSVEAEAFRLDKLPKKRGQIGYQAICFPGSPATIC